MKEEEQPDQPIPDAKIVSLGALKYMKNDVYVEMVSQGAYGKLMDPQFCTELTEIKPEWLALTKYLEKIKETN